MCVEDLQNNVDVARRRVQGFRVMEPGFSFSTRVSRKLGHALVTSCSIQIHPRILHCSTSHSGKPAHPPVACRLAPASARFTRQQARDSLERAAVLHILSTLGSQPICMLLVALPQQVREPPESAALFYSSLWEASPCACCLSRCASKRKLHPSVLRCSTYTFHSGKPAHLPLACHVAPATARFAREYCCTALFYFRL